jgi:16S rRNA processing protein RimM
MSAIPNRSQENQISGSPASGEPEFLAVGKLLRPHGVHGEIHLALWTDFPERLQPGKLVYVGRAYQAAHIKSLRGHEAEPLIAFDEISSREEAGQFRNQVVFVRTADLPPLPDDEIYLHQLIGLRVVRDEDDLALGVIAEILETGANHVFLVRREMGADLLLPDIDSVILKIDLKKGEVRVYLLPGLLPDDPQAS